MRDIINGIDPGIPTPEEFREELVAQAKEEKMSAELVLLTLNEYSRKYHQIVQCILNNDIEGAEELKSAL